jgi:predicted CoA-substrate-specific enzyme activase
MQSLGINIGSSTLKIVFLDGDKILWSKTLPHDGDFNHTVNRALAARSIPDGIPCLVTGTEGRFRFDIENVIEPLCIEEALKRSKEQVNAVVSLGGEDLVVYTVDEYNRIISNFSGNKCASGTGEFFKQQLARMDLSLENVNSISDSSRVVALSSRCSVFMKSDCTHKLNKGEATKDDIVLSLSDVMATKVIDFLNRARILAGKVMLTGGVTQNKHIVNFIRQKGEEIEFIVPEEASYFEAYGAAWLAQQIGSPWPGLDKLIKIKEVRFDHLASLNSQASRVSYVQGVREKIKPGAEYILGVDGGSTTTKACLINIESSTIAASYYGRTHGDPVKSLKICLQEIRKQVAGDLGENNGSEAGIRIPLAAVTGSSREILGVFLETPAVYNEIIAHSEGTIFYDQEVDTIFEIGGQDAKYVYLKNRVPIDYAMNEACSAGTGSFLEESAQGDLNIQHAHEIGDIALKAEKPLKFGEHCSAFINSDIRKAIQQGAGIEDITAGIITSIVANYLNRVVGNRSIGRKIALQGGVAKNKAVPLAFALFLNQDIVIPPDPELLGCFGVALLARQKLEEGKLHKSSFNLDSIIATEIIYEREFKCKSCDNYCPIRILKVNNHKYMFGGRCNKYANIRKKEKHSEEDVFDYVTRRMELMFKECAPAKEDFIRRYDFTVGIPRCFSFYTLYPLYSWFFHSLGIEVVLSQNIVHEGVARAESTYCFPAEIAHGAVQDIVDMGTDYIFLPHFRDMPSYEKDVHATFCPITQGLPYYIRQAFPEIAEEKILSPVISFKFGQGKALEFIQKMGGKMGIPESEIRQAFEIASEKQVEYFSRARDMGRAALREAREAEKPVIAILGKPYNAFTSEANMGIPKKFTSRGFSVIPFDILPFEDEQIFANMYWYYGQQDMKAAAELKKEDNIFITYITNFSCAPDSFMLHYLKWLMGIKPFLILELDSHTADAGVDTRVEAFLDIIDGYRSKIKEIHDQSYDNGLRFVNNSREELHIWDSNNKRKIKVKNNPRVKILLSNMGNLSTELVAAVLRSAAIEAEALPMADFKTLQVARSHTSGKECVPSHLVLGSALKYFSSDKYRKDQIYLLFVPITAGPCRTGQYYIFFENLFKEMRLENVLVLTMSADNSYTEFGPHFSKHLWWSLVVADLMKDIDTSLRACAADVAGARKKYDQLWHRLIKIAEKDITAILPALKSISRELASIPLKRTLKTLPKVLIVGEIYVRRDDFAVDELIRLFSDKGIVGKVSGVSEWIHYLDFIREYELKKRIRLIHWFKRIFSKEFRILIKLTLEKLYKRSIEFRVKRILKSTRLIPAAPHNMYEIMANTQRYFVDHELNSEIAVSSGAAATAMFDGYSGVVNISPFACLIGRVIEGVYTPWARERKYPVISVEVDGNLLPPNIINKLDIFTLNVLRFKQEPVLKK